jgi:hypothetical protein
VADNVGCTALAIRSFSVHAPYAGTNQIRFMGTLSVQR